MPAQYEALRDKFIKDGLSEKEAKTKAAKIFNALHPDKPLIRYVQKERKGK